MKKIIARHGLLAAVVSLLVLVFAFGGVYSRFMTAQIEARANEGANAEWLAMFPGANRAEEFIIADIFQKTYALAGGRGDFTPTIVAAYKLYAGDVDTAIGVIYVVESHGKFPGVRIAYAFDLATDTVASVRVIAQAETPSYYGTLGTAFFAQFDGMALDDIALGVDAVAGATYSSKSFEIALLCAREQYAADFGFVIPSVVMTLNSVVYNTDPATWDAMPFIADATYGEEDTNVVVYLDETFAYAGLVSGVEPEADVKAAIKSYAANAGTVSANVRFVEFDVDSRELVIESRGYSANSIEVKFVLNATLDGIVSYEVDSNESYHEEYNELYNHDLGEAPYVEENMIDQYQADEPVIDGVAGASITSAAMQKLIALLDTFLAANGGGD
ncbi:MAG: FMN-binding protein [Candidatus Izemoplasmatales bacterium]